METPDNNEIKEEARAATRPERGVGQLLRAARLEQGISIQDVARQLRFSARQVTALEEDKYDQLAGGTFLRGFVRNYAKLLQLDEAPLLRVLEQSVPPPVAHIVPLPIEGIPFPANQAQKKRILIIAGGAVIALLLLIYEIYRSNEASVEKQPSVGAEASMEGATAGVVPPPQAAAGELAVDGQRQQAIPGSASGVGPAVPSNGEPSPAAVVPAPSGSTGSEGMRGDEGAATASENAGVPGIRLVFEGESWTE